MKIGCELFNIRLETTVAKSTIPEDNLAKCKKVVIKKRCAIPFFNNTN